MTEEEERVRSGRARTYAAFGVHVFTASGAALALLALIAAVEERWPLMFAWLGLALLVDGIDGTFARMLHVKALAPRWSGDVLDLVVDVLTYVFIPAYAVAASGLFPDWMGLSLGLAIAVTGVLYFADKRMKSDDNYFIGFPAVWNVVVFYLFLLQPPAWLGAAALLIFCVLTFVPLPFVHPFRVRRLRVFNIALLAVWAALAVFAVGSALNPGPWVTIPLCLIAVHFIVVGAFRRSSAL
jgi:phosphatidylcholine synthase